MPTVLHDARLALRGVTKSPGFAALVVAMLAVGIGANTAVFSVVNGVLLRPLDYPEPGRLMRVFSTRPDMGWFRMTVSFPDYLDWREHNVSFSDIGIFVPATMNYTGGERPERHLAIQGSASLLPTLGFAPAIGRSFTPDEDELGAEPVVLVTDSFWRRSLGADSAIVGRTIQLDDAPYTVIGVLPPALERAFTTFDVMTPLPFDEARFGRGWRSFRVFARLRPGATLEQAQADLERVTAGIAEEFPFFADNGVNVEPLARVVVGQTARSTLFILMAAVGFVLLIACANIANLLLARGSVRRREFGLRQALGASRWRIARQVIVESLLLALAAGLLGLALASWGMGILVAGLSNVVARTGAVTMDVRVLAFTLVLSVVTAVLFSLLPALRNSASQPSESLKEGMRGTTSGAGGNAWRNALVVGQVALALALVVGAGQMIRSLASLRSVDPGFETDRLFTAQVQLPSNRYPTGNDQVQFYRTALERVREIPGVTAAGAVSALPMVGDDGNSWVLIEDYEGPEPGGGIFLGDILVTPGYFETMGMPLLRGRAFTDADGVDAPGVVIVNQYMAESVWPGLDPLGRRLRFGSDPSTPWLTVIGVVPDVRQVALNQDVRFETYRPVAQEPVSLMAILARTRGAPLAAGSPLRATIAEIDPDLAVFAEQSVEQIRAANSSGTASITWLLVAFAAVALILAAGGLYGVMSYVVSRRRHEIGIRIALGARTESILRLVLRRALVLTLLGAGAGLLIAFLLSGVLQSLLFGVSATDAVTLATVTSLLVVVGLLASYLPARRAARIPPMTALREE